MKNYLIILFKFIFENYNKFSSTIDKIIKIRFKYNIIIKNFKNRLLY